MLDGWIWVAGWIRTEGGSLSTPAQISCKYTSPAPADSGLRDAGTSFRSISPGRRRRYEMCATSGAGFLKNPQPDRRLQQSSGFFVKLAL